MSTLDFKDIVDRSQGNGSVDIRFVGTASFVIENEERSIVLDPFVTRPSLYQMLFPLKPNKRLIAEKFPRANEILIGHSHHDHLMDAPYLCQIREGSQIIGGHSTALLSKACGVSPQSIRTVSGHEKVPCGSGSAIPIPSRHAPVLMNTIIFDGLVTKQPKPPLRVGHFRRGEVFDWLVELGGKSILHVGSADFIEEEYERLPKQAVDIICLCAANWHHRKEDYIHYLLERFEPKFVIPCHWDSIFHKWGKGSRRPRLYSRAHLPDLINRINSVPGNTQVILLDFDGILKL